MSNSEKSLQPYESIIWAATLFQRFGVPASIIEGTFGDQFLKPDIPVTRHAKGFKHQGEGDGLRAGSPFATGRKLAQVTPLVPFKQIHQTMDSVSVCKPVTKFSAVVGAPHAVAEVVFNAFRAAESGRPGAAFVSLPKDIMAAEAHGKLLIPPAFSGFGPADAPRSVPGREIDQLRRSPSRSSWASGQQTSQCGSRTRFFCSWQPSCGRYFPVRGRCRRLSARQFWRPRWSVGKSSGRPIARSSESSDHNWI